MYLIFVFWAFCAFCCSCFTGEHQISDREKAVNKQMTYSEKMLSEKYNIRPCSTTVAMPGGDIQYLELEFEVQGPLSKEIIRKLLVQTVHDFLSNINRDMELSAYLKHGRMNISEIGIGLFLTDPSGRELKDPEICMASIRRGELKYYRCDSNDISINGLIRTQESYEEALKLLRDQPYDVDYKMPKCKFDLSYIATEPVRLLHQM